MSQLCQLMTINSILESLNSPCIHPAVDDGVVHGVTHGNPVDDQVDVLDVWPVCDVRVSVTDQKEEVLWQPAHPKDHHHHNHHTYNLQNTGSHSINVIRNMN